MAKRSSRKNHRAGSGRRTGDRKPARSSSPKPGGAPLRLVVIFVAACFVVLLPPARAVVHRGWAAVESTLRTVREAEAHEARVAAYAARYGIDPSLAAAIDRVARAEGVDTDLAFRLVRVESGFVERAVSPVGALGLTQLMPATAAELKPGVTREELFDRETNLRLGMRYLASLLRLYDDRPKAEQVREALHAYNRGLGTVARIRQAGGDPANGYAAKVLGRTGISPVGRRAPAAPSPAEGGRRRLHEMAPIPLPVTGGSGR